MKLTTLLVNGEPSDGLIPLTDSVVLRGDGCFEVLKSYSGTPFALEEHLDRLERGAAALGIELPGRSDITSWITRISEEVGDGAVRVVVSRGPAQGFEGEKVVAVFGHPWDRPQGPASLYPLEAPWHAAGVEWDLAGVKHLSYAPNMAAVRRANAEGFEDALLLTTDGMILEGPRSSVAWVVDGTLQTPGLDMGILDSITRRFVLDLAREAGIGVLEGVWPLSHLARASEVRVLSTIQEVRPVSRVGGMAFEEGSVTSVLSREFARLVG